MAAAGAVTLRHRLSGTPLEREHVRLLARRDSRAILPIPWRRFERDRYPAAALRLAADFQRDLAVGELLAVDSFGRVAAALALAAAPLDLVGATARVPADEIRHADYNLRMLALLEGCPLAQVRATLSAEELSVRARAYAGRPTTLAEIDSWMLEVPLFGETLACALLFECGRQASDPVAGALFRSVVADEIHHSRLGWYYMAWRSAAWSARDRERLAERAAVLVRAVPVRAGWGRDAPAGARRAARALGVLDTASQRKVIARALADELVPGLAALGLASATR